MDIEQLQSAAGQRYDVEGFLVEGGMGAIYTARHRSLGSRVAIKVLPPEVASSAVRLARFKREAALAANLSHPNIVPVFEFDATPDLAYLVMPYVEGETLADQLREEGKLEYSNVRRMLGQVASALGFAHAREVVHRDIKPANILREEAAGRWLITDFGIAHVTEPGDTEITQTGTIIGTPAYMSPEQRWGGQVDGRSDLYSLAAVVYQAICGTSTEQLPDDLLKERTELERAIRSAQPKLKAEVVRVLTWPLEIVKEDRPESAEAWLEALEQAEGTKIREKWAWAAGALAVLIAAGLWIFWPPPPPPPQDVTKLAIMPFQGIVQGDAEIAGLIPQLLELELQFLPGQYTVLALYDAQVRGVESSLDLARERKATLALLGRVTGTSGDLSVEVQVHDVAADAEPTTLKASGSVDDIAAMLTELRRQLLEQLAIEDMGMEEGVLAGLDLEAMEAYLDGEKDLRQGRYSAAVARFDEVIDSDSTFALAYFKRTVASLFDVRPSRYSEVVGTALGAASDYRDRLPPLSRQLLDAYEILLLDGDIDSAVALAQDLAERKPQADTYSLLGYVTFNFRAKLGPEAPGEAEHWFEQAVGLDSSFALALWHLAVIAMDERDREQAQRYIHLLRKVDSTSFWAEAVIFADSVLYGQRPNLVESFENMSWGALEIMIVPLGEMGAPAGTVPAASEALRVFGNRAETEPDRRLAFRMSMAERLARGRFAGADSLIREAVSAAVPRDEIDRWIVLSAITADAYARHGITTLPELADPEEQLEAVRRLESASESDAEAAWLVARWYLANEPSRAASRIEPLRVMARHSETPLAASLYNDIQALQIIADGDTTEALRLWEEATEHYSVRDDHLFGLTASLWPLRWRQVEVLAARGDSVAATQALKIAATFEQMFGFVDQVAWPGVLLLEMDAALDVPDGARARDARALLDGALDRDSQFAHELRLLAERKLAPSGN